LIIDFFEFKKAVLAKSGTAFFLRTNKTKQYFCNMKHIKLILIVSLAFGLLSNTYSQRFSFPQHTEYTGTHIKPSQYTQEELDNQVIAFYDKWKTSYLINGCEDNQYYVFFDSGNTLTVSEAMGYGMMIVPLMAGYDANAKIYFDGLYRFYKAHPSGINPRLMSWKQITGCVNADGNDSATDGDIDIAFGLLLAHAQWGSWDEINYFQEAVDMINAIMEDDIHNDYFSVKLGDWVNAGSYARGTRTSDFIFDHFRLFQCATNDANWNTVIDTSYYYLQQMQENYSQTTGLLPDFIEDINTSPRPADPDFLEGNHDGHYSYNACRDPWRLTTDYLISGEERAQAITQKINQWLITDCESDVSKVKSGYKLDGTVTGNWQDLSFVAPFTVGAMTDTENQQWLNDLYSKTLSMSFNGGGYYGNSIKLLSMLTISGNYWVPSCELMNGLGQIKNEKQTVFSCYPTVAKENIKIEFNQPQFSNDYEIIINNELGHRVLQSKTNTSNINISNLNAGLYFVSAIDKQTMHTVQTEKLIISK